MTDAPLAAVTGTDNDDGTVTRDGPADAEDKEATAQQPASRGHVVIIGALQCGAPALASLCYCR